MAAAPLTLRGGVPWLRRLPNPFARWPRAADAFLVAATFVGSVVVSDDPDVDFATRPLGDVGIADLLVFAVASVALMWRRTRPLEVWGVTLVASALTQCHAMAHGVALYGAGRYAPVNRWNAAGLAVSVALAAFDAYLTGSFGNVVAAILVSSLLWYAGLRMRYRGERAGLLERERAAQEQRVLAEERARIARELHDVVAHRVSLMTVQAGAAKTVAAVDPQGAVAAMAAVEEAGREALGELRHLLGVLRPDAEANEVNPQPGLDDVPRLAKQFEAAGLDVSLVMDDAPADHLPARVDLFAYRIVQEAMTNVLKHAGPGTRAEVRVAADDRQVTIEVTDDGRGAGGLPGSGHGLVGMRERALLLGGTLAASPRPGGGFRVVAHLPVRNEPAP